LHVKKSVIVASLKQKKPPRLPLKVQASGMEEEEPTKQVTIWSILWAYDFQAPLK
jgi:hypothetical protein